MVSIDALTPCDGVSPSELITTLCVMTGVDPFQHGVPAVTPFKTLPPASHAATEDQHRSEHAPNPNPYNCCIILRTPATCRRLTISASPLSPLRNS